MEREATRLREARAKADAAFSHLLELEAAVLDAQKVEAEALAECRAAKQALIDAAMGEGLRVFADMAQRVPVDG